MEVVLTCSKFTGMTLAQFDTQYIDKGINRLAGIDEAGRGPLAGPVVAAAVMFSVGYELEGIKDSKKLTAKKRETLFEEIQKNAEGIGIGIVHEKEIDSINILQATYKAMKIAIGKLKPVPDKILIDGPRGEISHYNTEYIVDGDDKSQCIAAASIIAKVTRDSIMTAYDKVYPEYGFARHKGYGTKFHLEAIRENKATAIHRKSFQPVKPHLPAYSYFNTPQKLGRLGEQLAATGLVKKGCEILAMNYRVHQVGEIDIIHQEGDELVFSEVKTLADGKGWGDPKDQIDVKKRDRIMNAAQSFLDEKGLEQNLRFDVISVRFSGTKPHISRNKGGLTNY